MPRFFFDVHDGNDFLDEDGTELVGIEIAKVEAARLAAGLLKDNPERFWNGQEWTVRVRDDSDCALFALSFVANLSPPFNKA